MFRFVSRALQRERERERERERREGEGERGRERESEGGRGVSSTLQPATFPTAPILKVCSTSAVPVSKPSALFGGGRMWVHMSARTSSSRSYTIEYSLISTLHCSAACESEGAAGGGAVAGRGRRERRDRGGSDKGENDESGTTARWHEGCSENRRGAARRERKRQTPKGGRRLAPPLPSPKHPCVVAACRPAPPPWARRLSFFLSAPPASRVGRAATELKPSTTAFETDASMTSSAVMAPAPERSTRVRTRSRSSDTSIDSSDEQSASADPCTKGMGSGTVGVGDGFG